MAAQWQPPRPALSPPPSQPMSAPTNTAVDEALARQIAANQLVVEEDSDDDSIWSATPRTGRSAPIGHSRLHENARTVPVCHTSTEEVHEDGEAGAPLPPVLLDEEITDDLFLKVLCVSVMCARVECIDSDSMLNDALTLSRFSVSSVSFLRVCALALYLGHWFQ